MDAMHFLNSEDPVEVAIMWAVYQSWRDRRLELNTHLATEIINRLAEALKK